MEGQGFIMTDAGILPMRPDGEFDHTLLTKSPAEMAAAAPPTRVFMPDAPRDVYAPPHDIVTTAGYTPAMAAASIAPLRPADVVKAAKARAKEIRAELKAMRKLQKELAELDRLIAAAKQKPVALVRNIDHARHAAR